MNFKLINDIQSCIEQLDQTSSLSKLISTKTVEQTSTTTSSLIDVTTLASKLESLKLLN